MIPTYKSECHFDGCDTKFIGIDRLDFIKHIRECHGESKAKLWDTFVVDEREKDALPTTDNDQ